MIDLSITEAVPGDQRPEADWGDYVTGDQYSRSQTLTNRYREASLHLDRSDADQVLQPRRRSAVTASMWAVWGNISTGCTHAAS
jgi:hypothetical protein